MTYDEDVQEWVLSSGRRFYAFTEILGIDTDRTGTIHSGSDARAETDDWPAEDRAEVADEMIRRWQAFKAGFHG